MQYSLNSPLTILVVEDEPEHRQKIISTIFTTFTNPDYVNVLEASHLKQAREYVRQNGGQINFGIIDRHLPRTQKTSETISPLRKCRLQAYSDWLDLDADGKDYNDSKWLDLRFKVDEFDQKVWSALCIDGGIKLIVDNIALLPNLTGLIFVTEAGLPKTRKDIARLEKSLSVHIISKTGIKHQEPGLEHALKELVSDIKY
ncbi:hypothetical protein CL633_00660 [bacterium]|nr:hypothetical protein [bacterium]|tara:strand:- start:45509 stop:46111 length:603 start_codon:yes stop_codon:yes gene_type:complete